MLTPHLVTIWGERHEGYKTVVYSTPLPSPDVCNSLDTEYYMKLSQFYAQHDAQSLFRRRGERADDTRLFWRRHVRAAGTELYLRLAQRLLIGVENYGVGFREHQVGAEHANKPNSAQVGVDKLVVGMVRTQANDNLVTDSDACAAALACDYCAQLLNCNSEIKFAAQQIGYTNPFGAYLSSSLGSGRRQYLRKKDGGKPIDGVQWRGGGRTRATREGTAEGSQQGLSCWQRPHLLLTVDHDCGGLTLPSKWDPRPFSATSCTSEHLVSLLGQCKGDGHKGYFATELLRQYGLSNATDDVGGMMDTYKRSGITALVVAVDQALAAKAGIHWSTTSHTSVDIDLYDAAGGGGGKGNRVLGRARMVLRSFVEQSE
ncbi:hypothetical protein NHJ13734_006675 [Beauveria thailandica]